MVKFIIGNTYKLIKPKKNKIKLVKLGFIDYNNNLLFFNYIKNSFWKRISSRENKDLFDIVLTYDSNDSKNFHLNNKKVNIEGIPTQILNSSIEQYNYINNLSDDIKDSIIEYTTNKYIRINKYLDDNCLPYNKELSLIINNIDTAFQDAPLLKEDIILYRGLNLPDIYDKKRNNNMKLAGYKGIYKGFISTSLLIYNTEMFQNKICCVLKINVPKNTKCLFIEYISNIPSEQEVLLQRNSILAISSFTNNNIINTQLISPTKL